MALFTIARRIACIEKNHEYGDGIGYNDYVVQDVNQLELSVQSRTVLPAFSSGHELQWGFFAFTLFVPFFLPFSIPYFFSTASPVTQRDEYFR